MSEPPLHSAGRDAADRSGELEPAGSENQQLAGITRQLGRLLPRGVEVDWQESRHRSREVLEGIISESADSRRLVGLLEGARSIVGGDEHDVLCVETDSARIYKLTRGDNFGCRPWFSPHDVERSGKHFHGSGNADPFFYLYRWMLLNCLGSYRTRFEGVVPAERPGQLPRFCVSQPNLEGENPPPEHIRKAMLAFGFYEVSLEAWLSPEAGVLLTDVAPRNVRIVKGAPVLFDAIAQFLPADVAAWLIGERSGEIGLDERCVQLIQGYLGKFNLVAASGNSSRR